MTQRLLLPLSFAAALAAAGCTMNEPTEAEAGRGEAELSAALAGYEQAGPPVSCVRTADLGGNRSAGRDVIIFEGKTSGRLYVNRPSGGCTDLNFGRALVTRTSGSQLCRGDIATVLDPVSGTEFGGCGLGDFTPYRRVRR